MNAIWIIVLFLEAVCASYFRERCYVRFHHKMDVEFEDSQKFLLHFPLTKDFMVDIPKYNVNLTNNGVSLPGGWHWVELFFYKKFELKLANGSVLLNNPAIDASGIKPPLEINFKNAALLQNCPEIEPVWRVKDEREVDLGERNKFSILCTMFPSTITLKVNNVNNTWNLTCSGPKNWSLNGSAIKFPNITVVKEGVNFKVSIADKHAIVPSLKHNRVWFSSDRVVYLVQLNHKKGEDEEDSGVSDNVESSTGSYGLIITVIAIFLLLSLLLNAVYTYYLRDVICGRADITKKSSTGHNGGAQQEPPWEMHTISNSGEDNYPEPEPVYLPTEQIVPHKYQVNDPGQKGKQRRMPPRATWSSVEEDDYINPEPVRPAEVAVMKGEKLIKGRVIQAEEVKEKKKVPKGEYINLNQVVKKENKPIMYDNDGPDYENVQKR